MTKTCPQIGIHIDTHQVYADKNRYLRNINREREDGAEGRSVLTKGTVAVIALHPALAGSTIETGVALTVIDSGVTRLPCD